MTRSIVTTFVLALVLTACAQAQMRSPQPAYVPSDDAAQAPLLSGGTVTGDTIREED